MGNFFLDSGKKLPTLGHGIVIAMGRKAITIMEIRETICRAVIGEQMSNKVIFTTSRAAGSGNSLFGAKHWKF
jgi:hypothetical protein